MVSLAELGRLERLAKMDYLEKLDGLANEGIEVLKDNRSVSLSVLNDRSYWPMYRVKWARSVNEVQQGQED